MVAGLVSALVSRRDVVTFALYAGGLLAGVSVLVRVVRGLSAGAGSSAVIWGVLGSVEVVPLLLGCLLGGLLGRRLRGRPRVNDPHHPEPPEPRE